MMIRISASCVLVLLVVGGLALAMVIVAVTGGTVSPSTLCHITAKYSDDIVQIYEVDHSRIAIAMNALSADIVAHSQIKEEGALSREECVVYVYAATEPYKVANVVTDSCLGSVSNAMVGISAEFSGSFCFYKMVRTEMGKYKWVGDEKSNLQTKCVGEYDTLGEAMEWLPYYFAKVETYCRLEEIWRAVNSKKIDRLKAEKLERDLWGSEHQRMMSLREQHKITLYEY